MNNNEENLYARDKAIKYIGISKKTEYEVKNKLKKLNIPSRVIFEEIEYLKELDYINDEKYVACYKKQCEKLLNFSIYEIKMKLLQKGIDGSIIENMTNYLSNSDYEEKAIEKLLQGKLKNYDDIKKRAYLYRRGFKI